MIIPNETLSGILEAVHNAYQLDKDKFFNTVAEYMHEQAKEIERLKSINCDLEKTLNQVYEESIATQDFIDGV